MRELVETLFEHRADALPARAFADLLDRIRWVVDTQFARELEDLRMDWLKSNDDRKVEISLLMEEVFPALSREELCELLGEICLRLPRLKEICSSWIDRWDEQFPDKK